MFYEGNIIRPPSEADSIILQVTVGCSYNHCTFCGAYKDIRFRIKEDEAIDSSLAFAKAYCRRQTRVFLADGDALVLPHRRLVSLFRKVRQELPWVGRISTYGNARAIRTKSSNQLKELKSLGLDRVYLGLESGHDTVLASIRKGETAQTMVDAATKVNDAGLFLSVTVLLGIGGTELSRQHAEFTGRIIDLMAPRQIAALTYIPLENTPLFHLMRRGLFKLPDANGMLEELKSLVESILGDQMQFHANHASNYLPLQGRLQRDKQKILLLIEQALAGQVTLLPESMRSL